MLSKCENVNYLVMFKYYCQNSIIVITIISYNPIYNYQGQILS